jgi:uncharacterized protein
MTAVSELRRAAGLTQDELARRSGVAQPNIAAYESGRRRASSAMIARLRAAAVALPRDSLARHRDELMSLAARHGLENLRVFGSVAKGSDVSGSDVDLLVTAPSGTGLMAISAFALAAEELLGMPVDIVTEGGLRADHRIRLEAVPL